MQVKYLQNKSTTAGVTWDTLYDHDDLVIGKCTVLALNDFKPHFHHVVEIYIITDGSGEVLINNEWFPAKKGDIFVINPFQWHCCKTNHSISLIYVFKKGPFKTIGYYSQTPNITTDNKTRDDLSNDKHIMDHPMAKL